MEQKIRKQLMKLEHLLITIVCATANVGAQEFTVITSNLYHSGTERFNYRTRTYGSKTLTLPHFATFFRRQIQTPLGIVGLQEVDKRTTRVWGLDTTQWLDDAMGHGWASRYFGLMDYRGGEFGGAALTNVPVAKTLHWRFAHDKNNPDDYGKEPRGALAMKLDFGGKRLWFVNTHLEGRNDIAMRQVWQLMGYLKQLDPGFPVIVVGDFNILNRKPSEGAPEREYAELATVFETAGYVDVSHHTSTRIRRPSAVLDGQLDYVFVYDPKHRLTCTRCDAYYVFAYPYVFSDHRPVVARFRWNW